MCVVWGDSPGDQVERRERDHMMCGVCGMRASRTQAV